MSDPTTVLTTIDDYLLSLADGIALAQNELSRTAASGPPGQQFSYYLPKLDFELRMKIQMTQNESLSQRYESIRDPAQRDKHLLFSPVPSTSSTSTEIISIVKGSFVAVPANNGLPGVRLSTSIDTDTDGTVQLTLTATTTAGEPVANLDVEVNVDREASDEMSAEQGVNGLDWTDTDLDQAVLQTDTTGNATVTLTVGTAMPTGAQLVLTIDAASQTELMVYQVTQ